MIRQRVEDDYEINLKAELEIKALHDKIDDLAARVESSRERPKGAC